MKTFTLLLALATLAPSLAHAECHVESPQGYGAVLRYDGKMTRIGSKVIYTVEIAGCSEDPVSCQTELTVRMVNILQDGPANDEGLANYHMRSVTKSGSPVVIACTGVAEFDPR